MRISIKFAGIGGQGIQLAAKLLGQASFKQGLNISQGTIYEPATSGGLTVADVTIAPIDMEIDYPFIEAPDVLVCFAQRAWDEYKSLVHDESIVLADKDNIQDFEGDDVKRAKLAFHLPFSSTARELGSEKVMNVVAIGFISEMLDFHENFVPALLKNVKPEDSEEYKLLEVAPEHFESSLIQASPERFREMNMNAYKAGYEMSLNTDYNKKLVERMARLYFTAK